MGFASHPSKATHAAGSRTSFWTFADALSPLAFGYFRASTRSRFLPRLVLIVVNGGADEIFQGPLVDLVALEKIDRSSGVAQEARIEEPVGIRQARPVGEGQLHLAFVGVGNRDHSVARPHRASHPLPFLDDFPVGLEDALADAGERLATPVRELRDQAVDTFRWLHWIVVPRIPVPLLPSAAAAVVQ